MFRSRLIFILLFLAYLGVTPAGVYTCACLVPAQAASEQIDLDEISEQAPLTDTAVTTLLTYFSLNFVLALAFLLRARREQVCRFSVTWLFPTLFCEPPPTPPPHFA